MKILEEHEVNLEDYVKTGRSIVTKGLSNPIGLLGVRYHKKYTESTCLLEYHLNGKNQYLQISAHDLRGLMSTTGPYLIEFPTLPLTGFGRLTIPWINANDTLTIPHSTLLALYEPRNDIRKNPRPNHYSCYFDSRHAYVVANLIERDVYGF